MRITRRTSLTRTTLGLVLLGGLGGAALTAPLGHAHAAAVAPATWHWTDGPSGGAGGRATLSGLGNGEWPWDWSRPLTWHWTGKGSAMPVSNDAMPVSNDGMAPGAAAAAVGIGYDHARVSTHPRVYVGGGNVSLSSGGGHITATLAGVNDIGGDDVIVHFNDAYGSISGTVGRADGWGQTFHGYDNAPRGTSVSVSFTVGGWTSGWVSARVN